MRNIQQQQAKCMEAARDTDLVCTTSTHHAVASHCRTVLCTGGMTHFLQVNDTLATCGWHASHCVSIVHGDDLVMISTANEGALCNECLAQVTFATVRETRGVSLPTAVVIQCASVEVVYDV